MPHLTHLIIRMNCRPMLNLSDVEGSSCIMYPTCTVLCRIFCGSLENNMELWSRRILLFAFVFVRTANYFFHIHDSKCSSISGRDLHWIRLNIQELTFSSTH